MLPVHLPHRRDRGGGRPAGELQHRDGLGAVGGATPRQQDVPPDGERNRRRCCCVDRRVCTQTTILLALPHRHTVPKYRVYPCVYFLFLFVFFFLFFGFLIVRFKMFFQALLATLWVSAVIQPPFSPPPVLSYLSLTPPVLVVVAFLLGIHLASTTIYFIVFVSCLFSVSR